MLRDRLKCSSCEATCEKDNVIGRGNLGTSAKPLCQRCYFNSSSRSEDFREPPESLCPTHHRPDKTYCLTCDELLCSSCVLHSYHRVHQILAKEKVDLIAEKKAALLASEIESTAQEGQRRHEFWSEIKRCLANTLETVTAEVNKLSLEESSFVQQRIQQLQAILASCGPGETPKRFIRSLESLPNVYSEEVLIESYIKLKSPIEEEVESLARDFLDQVALTSMQTIKRVGSVFKDTLQEMYVFVNMHQAGNCKILDLTAASCSQLVEGLDDCLASLNLDSKPKGSADPRKTAQLACVADCVVRRSTSEKPTLCSIIKPSCSLQDSSTQSFVFGKPTQSVACVSRTPSVTRLATQPRLSVSSASKDKQQPRNDSLLQSTERLRLQPRHDPPAKVAVQAHPENPSQATIARVFGSLMSNPERQKVPPHLKAVFRLLEANSHHLNLSSRNLTDLDMAYLLPFIRMNKQLSSLQVSRNVLTDRSLGLFAAAFKESKKVQIAVDGNQMSQSGILKMKTSFPSQIELLDGSRPA